MRKVSGINIPDREFEGNKVSTAQTIHNISLQTNFVNEAKKASAEQQIKIIKKEKPKVQQIKIEKWRAQDTLRNPWNIEDYLEVNSVMGSEDSD